MSNYVLIPFAQSLASDEIVSVEEVPSGLACNCICLFCKVPMVAKKGTENVHHFSHKSTDVDDDHVCQFNLKRAVYWILDQIASSIEEVHLPEFSLSEHSKHFQTTFTTTVCERSVFIPSQPAELLESDERDPNFRALKFVSNEGSELILVCSFTIGHAGIRSLLKDQIAPTHVIVCDLSGLLTQLNQLKTGFKSCVNDYISTDLENKEWLYHIDLASAEQKLIQQARDHAEELKKQKRPGLHLSERPIQKATPLSKQEIKSQLAKRLDELVQSAEDVFDAGFTIGLLCTACKFVSTPDTINCGYCGESSFDELKLSVDELRTLKPKFNCWLYPRASLSVVD